MDWQYLEMNSIAKTVFRPHGDNQFELIVLVCPILLAFIPNYIIFRQKNEYHQPCMFNTKEDGIDAYATSDLFEPHPTKSGLWRIIGRADDQIMHNTGEKVCFRIVTDVFSLLSSLSRRIQDH